MAIIVDVTLISGRRVSLKADFDASLQSLTKRERRALRVSNGRLFSSSGTFLDGDTRLRAARFQIGGCLTLQVGQMHICGDNFCFAAILGDGSAVGWGSAYAGGDSSAVQDQLKNVQEIQAS